MNEQKRNKTTQEVEKQLEELIKIKLMRTLTAKLDSKKFMDKWKPALSLLETVHPGSLQKLEKIVKDSLSKKGG